jgi:hypothetical protein
MIPLCFLCLPCILIFSLLSFVDGVGGGKDRQLKEEVSASQGTGSARQAQCILDKLAVERDG